MHHGIETSELCLPLEGIGPLPEEGIPVLLRAEFIVMPREKLSCGHAPCPFARTVPDVLSGLISLLEFHPILHEATSSYFHK